MSKTKLLTLLTFYYSKVLEILQFPLHLIFHLSNWALSEVYDTFLLPYPFRHSEKITTKFSCFILKNFVPHLQLGMFVEVPSQLSLKQQLSTDLIDQHLKASVGNQLLLTHYLPILYRYQIFDLLNRFINSPWKVHE